MLHQTQQGAATIVFIQKCGVWFVYCCFFFHFCPFRKQVIELQQLPSCWHPSVAVTIFVVKISSGFSLIRKKEKENQQIPLFILSS